MAAAEENTAEPVVSTAGERLSTLWDQAVDHLTSLDPTQIAINLSLTVAVAAVLWAATSLFRRFLSSGARKVDTDTIAKQVYIAHLIKLALSVIRWAMLLAAIYLIARVWGFDLLAWTESPGGAAFLRSLLRLVLLVAAAVAANELARFVVNHLLENIGRRSTDPRRAAQLNTLGPLLRGLAQIFVVVIAALTILGELGVQIGPLIAGAGVVGVALGFGSQTLIKDFLTGVFLIMEDVVSVGDVVRVGDSAGLVEKMTLRTLQLRDYDGTLHVLPYSEAQIVHNMTKDFSFYVFLMSVSYGTDLMKAMEVMRRVTDEVRAEPEFRDDILEPLEIAGVDAFGDSGIVIKARLKTLPLKQWGVGRECNRRMKVAFDKEGISIPFPHVQLVLPPGAEGQKAEPPKV